MDTKTHNPADYIVPLSIGGLEGRMLHIPSEKKREIMFVYGHHASLERWWGLMEVLTDYGKVTMPDLPGFGGMDSFYKVGRKPSIDEMADYLAAFIKWRYKRKKVTIIGLSFGFIVATRMLQRYPELIKKVDILVSVVGFTSYDEMSFSRRRRMFYLVASRFFGHYPAAWLWRHIGLNKYVLRAIYARTANGKKKFAEAGSKSEFDRMMDMEISLWQCNDVRTYMYTSGEILTFNNTDKYVNLPVWHVSSEQDHFLDHTVVEQHMRVIFSDFVNAPTAMLVHAPSVIADRSAVDPYLPESLKTELAREPSV